MSNTDSNFKIALDVFTEPKRAFASIEKRGRILLPFILLVICTGLITFLYASSVDFSWMVDQIISSTMSERSGEEIEGFKNYYTYETFFSTAIASAIVIQIAVLLLLASYLSFVGKVINTTHGFKLWLSMVSWAYLPTLLSSLAIAVSIFLSTDGQLSIETLDPLSLNSLWLNWNSMHDWFAVASILTIPQIWVWVIMTIGFSHWTKKSIPVSAVIVLAPFVVYMLLTGLL